MINNSYAYEMEFKFDLEIIRSIAMRNKDKKYPELVPHQRYVKDEPYLLEIQKAYPFLSNLYNIYTYPANGRIPLHVDGGRKCTLNIPIKNTENSHTIFYESLEEIKTEYVETISLEVKSLVREVFRFSLLRPTLVNVTVPHEMINLNPKNRVILSWSISSAYDFEKAKHLF